MVNMFETKMVDTAQFLRIFTFSFLRVLGAVFLFWAFVRMFLHLLKMPNGYCHKFVKELSEFSLTAVLCVFKVVPCYTLVKFIFFFDFSSLQFTWRMSVQLPLTTLFTGTLAVYELIAALLQIILLCKTTVTKLTKTHPTT